MCSSLLTAVDARVKIIERPIGSVNNSKSIHIDNEKSIHMSSRINEESGYGHDLDLLIILL